MDIKITDNPSEKQFESNIQNELAKIEYIISKDKIYLTHTEVPPALGGKGIGSALMKGVFEIIEKRNLKLVPLCPFVLSYLNRHQEWNKLLA